MPVCPGPGFTTRCPKGRAFLRAAELLPIESLPLAKDFLLVIADSNITH
jgi:hypothetical protein